VSATKAVAIFLAILVFALWAGRDRRGACQQATIASDIIDWSLPTGACVGNGH
jgi:hypothetical protein